MKFWNPNLISKIDNKKKSEKNNKKYSENIQMENP